VWQSIQPFASAGIVQPGAHDADRAKGLECRSHCGSASEWTLI